MRSIINPKATALLASVVLLGGGGVAYAADSCPGMGDTGTAPATSTTATTPAATSTTSSDTSTTSSDTANAVRLHGVRRHGIRHAGRL